MAKLDSLIIDLQVNTAALKSGLDTAKSALGSFSKQVDAIKDSMQGMVAIKVAGFAKDMAEAVVHLTEQMAEFVLHGSEATDHIRQLAEASGEGVKAFSELAFASTSVGLGTDDLAKGLEKLDKNLGAAGAGVRQQAGLFNALGVAVTDSSGSVRSTDTVFKDLADRFANMEDGASKTALAIKVFGKAGAEMIPFLNQGARGIEQLEAQARQLGITLNEQDSDAAHAFQSALKQVDGVVGGVAAKVATELTPALTRLAEDFLRSSEAAGLIKDTISAISTVFKVIISEAANAGAQILVVGRTIGAVAAALSSWNTGGPAEVFAQLEKDNKATYDALGRLLEDINGATQDFNQNLQPKAGEGPGGLNADKILKDASSVNVAAEAMKKLNAVIDEYKAKIAELASGSNDPFAKLQQRLSDGDLSKDLAKIGTAAAGVRDELLDLGKTAQWLSLQKIQLTFQTTEGARESAAATTGAAALARSGTATSNEAQKMQAAFDNVGSPDATVKKLMSGFKGFSDALQQWTDDTKASAAAQQQVSQLEATAAAYRDHATKLLADGFTAAALDAQDYADAAAAAAIQSQAVADADSQAAEAAKLAADAFKTSAQDFHATFENFSGALDVGGKAFISKMGKLGATIEAGIQGFSQGGIWGALIAVLAEFITQVKGWTSVMTIGNGQFQMALRDMAQGLNGFLDGFKDLMGGVEQIANAVHGVLSPILELIGTLLKGIAPVLGMVGLALQPLAPIFQIIGGVLENTLEPAFQTMGPILFIIDEILMGVSLAFQFVKLGLDVFLDWIYKIVGKSNQDAVNADNAAIYGPDGTLAKMKDMADAFANGITNNQGGVPTLTGGTDYLTKQANDQATAAGADGFNTPVLDATGAVVNFGAATGKATTALQGMTQSFLNIPDGFKTALRRFEAQSPTNGAPGVAKLPPLNPNDLNPNGSQKGSSSGPAAGTKGSVNSGTQDGKNAKGETTGHSVVHNYNIGSVNLQAGNLDQLSEQLKKLAAKKRFHTTGAPGVP